MIACFYTHNSLSTCNEILSIAGVSPGRSTEALLEVSKLIPKCSSVVQFTPLLNEPFEAQRGSFFFFLESDSDQSWRIVVLCQETWGQLSPASVGPSHICTWPQSLHIQKERSLPNDCRDLASSKTIGLIYLHFTQRLQKTSSQPKLQEANRQSG